MNDKFTRSIYHGKQKNCRADDCGGDVYGHGLCSKHYNRHKRHGNFNTVLKVGRQHGLSKHDLYNTWKGMMDRCYKETAISYKNYGGRGIVVCDRWHLVENFIEDMGDRPSPEHELDRKDTDGNYEPNNCRWSDKVEQAYNRRNVKGVCWNRFNNKWMAYFGGKSTGGQIVGYFNTKEEAVSHRKELEVKHAR